VSHDKAAVFEMVRTYGSNTTPTVVIGEEVVVGFDPFRMDELLDD
jgi:glutaredoxin